MFFGEGAARLFGVHHPPEAAPLEAAVLLCAPGEHEGNAAHRPLKRLAELFARAGVHVLRFDWRGTGDSAGETGAGDPAQWADDVRAAARELVDLSGVRALSVVGLRLGGALAARACATGLRVRDLVLWEPVASGRAYLAELETADARRNLQLLHPRSPKEELLGFPLSPRQREELARLEVAGAGPLAARRVLLFASAERPADQALQKALVAAGARCELHLSVGEPLPALVSAITARAA